MATDPPFNQITNHHESQDDGFEIRLIRKYYAASSFLRCQIIFNFHVNMKVSQYIITPDSPTPQFLGLQDVSDFASTRVSVSKFLLFHKNHDDLYQETCEAIEDALSALPLTYYYLSEVIEQAWVEAWRGHVRYKTLCCYTDLELHFLVQIEQVQVFDASKEGIVPNSDSSVQSLEKYDVDGKDISCRICLEDFSGGGGEVLRMPCSHAFHSGCIKEWLMISHHCPLCRFGLPTWVARINDFVHYCRRF